MTPASLPPADVIQSPSLRTDLRTHSQQTAAGVEWIIEDPLRGEFFRLGGAEFALASSLGVANTVEETLAVCQRNHPECDLTLAEAAELIRWLMQSHLLTGLEPTAGQRLAREHSRRQVARDWQWLNLFCLRVPLWKPGRELDALTAVASWFFSPAATILVLAFIVGVFAAVLHQRTEFTASLGTLFIPQQQMWLLLAWVLLKVIHEAGHAIVCRRYGGEVREAGLLLILFVPAAYVDVSSSWRFASRWQRIHTAAAGMYVELTFAAIAGLAWLNGANQWWSDLAAQIVLLSSVSTLLTNLNPLARFDGYFMLSDWLRIPNLAERGATALQDAANRWLLGVPVPSDSTSRFQQVGLFLYGTAAWIWRLSISLSLIVVAAAMFQGVGILLAAAAVLLWFVLPIARTTWYLLAGDGSRRPNLVRLTAILVPTCCLLVGLMLLIPMPGTTFQPGIVEYVPEAVVRAETAGFVRSIQVRDGDEVTAGQLLVELENEPLRLQLEKIELECGRLAAAIRRLQAQQRNAELESAHAEWTGHEKQRRELVQKIERLRITAPHDGRVIARRLADRVGTYMQVGEELLIVGDHADKQVRVSWTARDVQTFSSEPRTVELEIRLPTWRTVRGELLVIEPRGQVTPTHPAICSPFGGPLAAKRVGEKLELLEPRFEALLTLPDDETVLLHAGEIVHVRPLHLRTSIAAAVWEWCQTQSLGLAALELPASSKRR